MILIDRAHSVVTKWTIPTCYRT